MDNCHFPQTSDAPTVKRYLDGLLLNFTRLYGNSAPVLAYLNDDLLNCSCSSISSHLSSFDLSLHCVSFPFQHSVPVQAFYIILFTATIAMALIGNFTVMWIVLHHKSMRTVTNYYLLNLAVADVTISIFNTGFSWTYNFYYQWLFGLFYCRINNLMGITPICASVFTMIVMSIDRYYAIIYPLRRRPGRKATVAVISAVWFLAFLCGLPSFFLTKIAKTYFYDGVTLFEHTECMADSLGGYGSIWSQIHTTGLVIIEYFIPLLILSFAYFRVGAVLRRDKYVGDSRHDKSIRAKKKAAFMLALVVFIFMLVWFPYNTYFLLNDYFPDYVRPNNHMTDMYIYINVYWLGMSSTVFNPIIYYFMNRRFRLGFHYAFRFLPCVRATKSDYRAVMGHNGRPVLSSQTAVTEF